MAKWLSVRLRIKWLRVRVPLQSLTMLKSTLCHYNDAYILVKGTKTVPNTAAAGADANNTNNKVIFKNCASYINCINEINNTQVDNAKDIDIIMLIMEQKKLE